MADLEEPPNLWLLGPVSRCLEYLIDELVILALVERGMRTLTDFPTLLEVMARFAPVEPAVVARIRELQTHAIGDATQAQQQLERGIPASHTHACIAFWSGVETCIEDTLVNHMLRVPNAVDLVMRHFPDVRQPKGALDRRSARRYVRNWEQHVDAENTIDCALAMLKVFSLDFAVDHEVKRDLIELCEYRNIAAHRAGVVDADFKTRVPWVTLEIGQTYMPDRDRVNRLHDACGKFTLALLQRATESPWIFHRAA